jgi:hypothetical protein
MVKIHIFEILIFEQGQVVFLRRLLFHYPIQKFNVRMLNYEHIQSDTNI